jgi:hypothetical protein
MKARGVVSIVAPFLTSALDRAELSVSCPGRVTPDKFPPSSLWVEGWAELRTGLDPVEDIKIFPCRVSNTGLPARSRHYSDWAIATPNLTCKHIKIGWLVIDLHAALSVPTCRTPWHFLQPHRTPNWCLISSSGRPSFWLDPDWPWSGRAMWSTGSETDSTKPWTCLQSAVSSPVLQPSRYSS